MEIRFEVGDPLSVEADALIVPIGAGDDGVTWTGVAGRVNESLTGQLAELARDARFTGKVGKTFVVPTMGQLPAKRLILVGLGKSADAGEDAVTQAAGAGVRAARETGAKQVAAALTDMGWEIDPATALEAAALGARLGLYRFDQYRGSGAADGDAVREIETIRFITPSLAASDGDRALARAEAIANGVNLARDLTNEPGANLTPEALAQRARDIADASGLAIEILGPAELEALGAEATLAVGGGSANPPRLIRLRYEPSGEFDRSRVPGLVGKAITFDTGGYSIKPYEGMLTMKGDMAGGAAVLGAMSALRALECPVPVVATICAAENMISGTAFRPGDILKGMNGVTMEILSTDAEGRLVLADGLVDTARRGATELIDLATLTGAAIVALGEGTTALFATDDALAAKLLEAADKTGERMWRMPLIDDLERKIEGDVGDIKNSGGRAGGAITAALFLRHFREGLPWAHLDIAGTNKQDKATAIGPKGATGVGVRTLLEYLTATSTQRAGS